MPQSSVALNTNTFIVMDGGCRGAAGSTGINPAAGCAESDLCKFTLLVGLALLSSAQQEIINYT